MGMWRRKGDLWLNSAIERCEAIFYVIVSKDLQGLRPGFKTLEVCLINGINEVTQSNLVNVPGQD